MNATFSLRRGSPLLKLKLTFVHHRPRCGETLSTHILTAVLYARIKVWEKTMDTTLIWYGPRHALGNFHPVAFDKVAALA